MGQLQARAIARPLHLRAAGLRAPLATRPGSHSAQLRKSDPPLAAILFAPCIRPGCLATAARFQRPLDLHAAIGRVAPSRLGPGLVLRVPPEGSRSPDGPQPADPDRSRTNLSSRSGERWRIVTGRPHQIRIHTGSLGAPCWGRSAVNPRLAALARDEALPGRSCGTPCGPPLRLFYCGGEELAPGGALPADPAQLAAKFRSSRREVNKTGTVLQALRRKGLEFLAVAALPPRCRLSRRVRRGWFLLGREVLTDRFQRGQQGGVRVRS